MIRDCKYPIARSLSQLCSMLKLSPTDILKRTNLSADVLDEKAEGVTAIQFFSIFQAVQDEVGQPCLSIKLGQALARGPFLTGMYIFSCSPNILTGMTRLTEFKSLLGPIKARVERSAETVQITFASVDPRAAIPDAMAEFELVYFVELCRLFTAESVKPIRVEMPHASACLPELGVALGVEPIRGSNLALTLSRVDALRPLITSNPELWAMLEPRLRRNLIDREGALPISVRVKNALLELLPTGIATIDAICNKLRVSERTLQRQLRAEGQNYQSILDATRADLAIHYLVNEDIAIDEISHRLAYRDPNSFYRAFGSWTGKTPTQVRSLAREQASFDASASRSPTSWQG